MTAVQLAVLNDDGHQLDRVPVEDGITIELKPVTGSSAIRVKLEESQRTIFCGSIPAASGRTVSLRVFKDQIDIWQMEVNGEPVERRALNSKECRFPKRVSHSKSLDLVFLLDTTTIIDKTEGNFFGSSTCKQSLADQIDQLISALSNQFTNIRCLYLTFSEASATDGKTTHNPLVNREFVSYDPDKNREVIHAVKPQEGDDYIDAVSEALLECNTLPWNTNTTRLTLLVGDSPGFSVLNPPPSAVLNGRTRAVALEEALDELHENNVTVITLYIYSEAGMTAENRSAITYSIDQYSRIASASSVAGIAEISESGLQWPDPCELVDAYLALDKLARGDCYGELVPRED